MNAKNLMISLASILLLIKSMDSLFAKAIVSNTDVKF